MEGVPGGINRVLFDMQYLVQLFEIVTRGLDLYHPIPLYLNGVLLDTVYLSCTPTRTPDPISK